VFSRGDPARALNIEDLRLLARKRLPKPIFEFLDGGADDEETLRRNTTAFSEFALVPDVLANDVSSIDLSRTILGQRIEWPVILSPAGAARLFHCDGEPAIARAAARSGTIFALSTMSNTSLEDVARSTGAPKFFQLYIFRDRGVTRELVTRCKSAGYQALCLTVDAPLGGNRERDRANGLSMPPRVTVRSCLSFAAHPAWSLDAWRRLDFAIANFEGKARKPPPGYSAVQYVNSLFDRTVTWKDVEWLSDLWAGPLVIKGILSASNALRAADMGVSAVMISNHGGRQLDAAAAPFDQIARIRDAVGERLAIILDGGVRRGTHVVKAIARGADACSIGRPYLFGLAAAGEAGVDHALKILRSELERDMALLGCSRLAQIGSKHIARLRNEPVSGQSL
jgi:L-lactate dehydrogenase (cytochrome)